MKLTQAKFKEQSNIDSKLIDAVIKQIGGWTSFKEKASDITNSGASGGIRGFIYYSETIKFAENNRSFIKALLQTQVDECGDTFGNMLGNFNCLKISESEAYEAFYDKEDDNYISVYNAMAWFALEEVARSYCDLLDFDS